MVLKGTSTSEKCLFTDRCEYLNTFTAGPESEVLQHADSISPRFLYLQYSSIEVNFNLIECDRSRGHV